MSRRRKDQQSREPSPHLNADVVADESTDDELARELEQERQNILAAASNDQDSAHISHPDSLDSSTIHGDDASDVDEDVDDEQDSGVDNIPDEEGSGDEWQPPEPASRPARSSKRRRRQPNSEDSDNEDGQLLSESDEEPVSKKNRRTASSKSAKAKKTSKANGQRRQAEETQAHPAPTEVDGEQEEAEDSFDEEAERVQAEVEAAAAWADVRRRKEAATSQTSTNGSATQGAIKTQAEKQPFSAPSLTAWLGKGPSASSSVSELAASLPMPTTCTAAQIIDRNSLFIGYVYPLTSSSSAYISTLLSHLSRVVHPTVSIDLLPPQFANAPANKRGSSHDMYAYRVFELKRGRTGLAGPDDFSLQEDKEDDGERWGGDRVLRVAREEGASDVLVVVSRWYGGELLGPVRFDHIENAARAALQEHMNNEQVDEFRQRIQYLDRKIAQAKAKMQGIDEVSAEMNAYVDLTVEKAQRLWLARQKTLEALQKRIARLSSLPSQTESQVEEMSVMQETAESISGQTDPTIKPQPMPESLDHAASTIKPEPNPTAIPPTEPLVHMRIKQEQEQDYQPHLERKDKVKEESNTSQIQPKPEHAQDDLTGCDDLS